MSNVLTTPDNVVMTPNDFLRCLEEERKRRELAMEQSANEWKQRLEDERKERDAEFRKEHKRYIAYLRAERKRQEAALEEYNKRHAESLEEERKRREESLEEERKYRIREAKEYNKRWKEIEAGLGRLMNRNGEITEYTFNPVAVMKLFINIGYDLTGASRRMKIKVGDRFIAEIDILLLNGEYVVFVEIKTNLTTDDIDKHVKRIETVYQSGYYKDKKIIGAVAGRIIPDNVKTYAQESGLYVIEQAGDAIRIASEDNFKHKEW